MPHLKNDHGIFVTKIRDNGTAFEDGRLKEGDKILEVSAYPSSQYRQKLLILFTVLHEFVQINVK